ncbi:MAG: hypothetical protein ACRD0Z_13035 [Acidimicrobiales bacterium]
MHSTSRFSPFSFRMRDDDAAPTAITTKRLKTAFAAAPASSVGSIAMLAALGTLLCIWAHPEERAGCFLLLPAALLSYLVCMASGRREWLPISVTCETIACVLADLPVDRSGAVVVASISGALFLCYVELAANAVSPPKAMHRLHGPALQRALWVTGTAVAGGVLGWLLLSLRNGLGDFGLIALGAGAAAAALVAVMVATLALGALGELSPGRPKRADDAGSAPTTQ